MSQQNIHWRDRAITVSEAISDTFDVFKAYGAHLANWVLFFCLLANLIEMVSPAFEALAGMVIVGVQSISLDVAGFGLTAMAASAKRRGDEKSATKANVMGWTLITVMAVTVGLITAGALHHEWDSTIQQANQVFMFIRVIVTVFYGHIVHQIREERAAHENRLRDLETEVSSLQKQLKGKEQEVSSVQLQLSNVQKQVSSGQQEVDGLRHQLDTLRGQLDIKQQEIESLHTALNSGHDFQASRVSSLQQEVEREQATRAALQRELLSAKAELERVQFALSTEQHTVSSGQADGQSKVVQLDSRRRAGQDDTEDQIRALHKTTPVQSLSARAIAGQIGCSPTTAAKWKTIIENEEKSVVNE